MSDSCTGWSNIGLSLLLLLVYGQFAVSQTPPEISPTAHRVRIRIVNAQTNKPVANERLNVSLHKDQVGFTIMPTDKNGAILVDTGDATEMHVLSNFFFYFRSN